MPVNNSNKTSLLTLFVKRLFKLLNLKTSTHQNNLITFKPFPISMLLNLYQCTSANGLAKR